MTGSVDLHTGQTFSDALQPYADAQPQRNWRIVEVPGLSSQPGFSLRLPFGWELHELQGTDSYVGEVIGDDGIRLTFDYGENSWSLDPADDPVHDYFVAYEDISGLEAKLLISTKVNGYIEVYFPSLGGPSLSIVGENLAPSEQQAAIAGDVPFRSESIEFPNVSQSPEVVLSTPTARCRRLSGRQTYRLFPVARQERWRTQGFRRLPTQGRRTIRDALRPASPGIDDS